MGVAHLVNYCLECEWSASSEHLTRSEQGRLAVEHAVTTGHDIDSERQTTGRRRDGPTSGRRRSEGGDRLAEL